MNLQFEAIDIWKAAILLEEKGEKFYREAAAIVGKDAAKLLEKLAELEKIHAQKFADLADRLERQKIDFSKEDNDGEKDFLSAMTDDRIITRECSISPNDNIRTILEKAMLLEKNSVFFYSALKSSLVKHMSSESIDALIAEEVNHFRMLSKASTDLQKRPKKD